MCKVKAPGVWVVISVSTDVPLEVPATSRMYTNLRRFRPNSPLLLGKKVAHKSTAPDEGMVDRK